MILKLLEHWVFHYPKTIISITLFLSVLIAPFLSQIENDPSPHLLPPHHPVRQDNDLLREDFTGTNPGIFIMLETENDIFNSSTLTRIQDLTTKMEMMRLVTDQDVNDFRQLFAQNKEKKYENLRNSIPRNADELDDMFWMDFGEMRDSLKEEGSWQADWDEAVNNLEVRSAPVVSVTSLANTDDILGTHDGLSIEPIFEDVPDTPQKMEQLKSKVLQNDLFINSLFSEDAKRSGIYVELSMSEEDTENLYDTYQAIEAIFEQTPGDEKHYIAGFPIIAATLRTVIDQDTQRFFPFVALLAIFFLWLTFRKFIGVAVPMIVVGFSILFTMGLMVFFDVPLNSITSALPVFLISIGVADGIHMFSAYRDHRLEGHDRKTAVSMMLNKLTVPVIMTSITTAIGFFSLTISDIVPILTFGIFVALGTLFAMVFSLLFIPALLMVLPEKKEPESESTHPNSELKKVHQVNFMDHLFQHFLEYMTELVVQNARKILFVALLIFIASAYGMMQVQVESGLESYFSPDAPFVKANKAMEKMSGSRTVNLLIRSSEKNEPWKKPENLKIINDLQVHLENHEMVRRTFSLVDLIKRISFAFHENQREFSRIPNVEEKIESEEEYEQDGETRTRTVQHTVSGRDLVAQYLVLYENSGGDVLADVVDSDYSTLNVSVNISSNSTNKEQRLLEEIEAYAAAHFPPTMELKTVGMIPINVATSHEVVSSQVRSLLGSLVVVMLMLMLIFRSIKRGMLGMIPLLFTVLFNFGIMGYFGIYLDIGTALVSSIVIGIGVDYSIHYLSRMFRENAQGLDLRQSISNTVHSSGKAITSNAVTVGFGFLALSVSEFLPLVTLSWMIWLTLNISALATMVLVPALAVTFPNGFQLQKNNVQH